MTDDNVFVEIVYGSTNKPRFNFPRGTDIDWVIYTIVSACNKEREAKGEEQFWKPPYTLMAGYVGWPYEQNLMINHCLSGKFDIGMLKENKSLSNGESVFIMKHPLDPGPVKMERGDKTLIVERYKGASSRCIGFKIYDPVARSKRLARKQPQEQILNDQSTSLPSAKPDSENEDPEEVVQGLRADNPCPEKQH